jgi:hypothetical protein
MSDSRPAQMAAAVDEVRAIAADMSEEGVASNHLEALRCSLNVSLRYIEMLRVELNEGNESA